MTKRECLDFCYEQIITARNKPISKPIESHENIHNTYLHCKQVCAENGYVGGVFVELWNKAVDKHARNMRVLPDNNR